MRWIHRIPLRLRSLFRKGRAEQELDEELRFHLEKLTEENIAKGMAPEEARYAALREFGGVEQLKEECRDAWHVRLITELVQDVRYGLRQLRRNPGFTVVAVLTLALGIGANTAIFSVVNAVVLRPLPIYQPGRVVTIHDHYAITGLHSIPVSAPQFAALSRRTEVFARTAVVTGGSFDLNLSGQPERVKSLRVSAGFFPLLGVRPRLGRWLLPSEDRPGANHVVVISTGLWQRAFASSPEVIGRSITLNNEDYTVVGVMPASFSIPHLNADLWTPLALTPAQLDPSRQIDHQWLYMIARRQQGVTFPKAQAALDNATAQFRREFPNHFPARAGFGIRAVPFTADLVGETSGYLFLLLAAVGFILLIACANLANLTLSRTSTRSREMALRTALGASRSRVFRQLLTESVLLSLAGGGVGLCLALAGLAGVKSIDGGNVPRLDQAGIGTHVLLFTAVISLVTGVLFGLAPAIQASGTGLSESLKEGGRSVSETGGHQRIRNLLVVSEVSLTLVLLAGTLLMTKSFARLLDVNPGFDPHNVLTLRIALPSPRYSSDTRVVTFYQSLMHRVRRLPGVEAAGAVSQLPFSGVVNSGSFRIEDRPMGTGVVLPHANIRQTTPGFIRALRVPLRMGRTFTEADDATAPKVAIVDTTLARLYWPKQNPIGQRVLFPLGSGGTWRTVVGIVGNVRYGGFSAPRKGVLYIPEAQSPQQNLSLVIRTVAAPAAIANEVRRAVSDVDSQQPIYSVKTMGQYISESVTDRSLDVFLLSIFGGLALVLASVGIYGVIAYDVTRRTHDIGIRMALGAEKRDVLRMVLGQGFKLALIGVAVGIAGALVLTRFLSSLLYGVKPTDPLTFIAVSLILIAVALLACYVPARRAAKVDPMVALRYE